MGHASLDPFGYKLGQPVFPVALALSYGDRLSPIRNNNGWLAFARRSAGMHEDILV